MRAGYGEALLKRLSADLTARFGRGFSVDNLEAMRVCFLAYPPAAISETSSRETGPAGLAGWAVPALKALAASTARIFLMSR